MDLVGRMPDLIVDICRHIDNFVRVCIGPDTRKETFNQNKNRVPVMDYTFILHLIPFLCISAYFPIVCHSDMVSRSFHPKRYWPLALLGIVSLAFYFSESPLRNYYMFGLSGALCLIFVILSFIRIIGFSDAVLISLILLIMQYNPFTQIRVFFPIDYFWCIMILTCALPIFTWISNIRSGKKMGVIDMLTHMRDQFPYTVLIAAAFFITIIAEVII